MMQQQCGIIPHVKIEEPNPFISQIRHTADGKEIFFFSNCHVSESFPFTVTFPSKGKTAWLWDPETGERFIYPTVSKNNLTTLSFDMEPAGSKVFIFQVR